MTGVGVFDAKLTTPQLSTGLLVLAYLLAVVDGTLQDKGLYPSSPGRTGLGCMPGHTRGSSQGPLAELPAPS